MAWLVWRDGWDQWQSVWSWMDARTKADLESRGYTVARAGEGLGIAG